MREETRSTVYPAVQFRIARPTNKLRGVVQFYTEGLQLKVLYSFEDHEKYSGVMIGLPDERYHLEFTQDDERTSGLAPTTDNLLVFYFPSLEALQTIQQSLTQIGYKPVEPVNLYWQEKGCTYEDPDGWRIVLYNGTFLLK